MPLGRPVSILTRFKGDRAQGCRAGLFRNPRLGPGGRRWAVPWLTPPLTPFTGTAETLPQSPTRLAKPPLASNATLPPHQRLGARGATSALLTSRRARATPVQVHSRSPVDGGSPGRQGGGPWARVTVSASPRSPSRVGVPLLPGASPMASRGRHVPQVGQLGAEPKKVRLWVLCRLG
jgi:hypothetical protein